MATGTIHSMDFMVVSYSASYTASANGGVNLTANDFSISTPTGYTPIAVVQFGSGNGNVNVRYMNAQASGTNNAMGLRSVNSSSVSASASMAILYMRK